MTTIRHENNSTYNNLQAIVNLINNPITKEIKLFATDEHPKNKTSSDGVDFPLVVALIKVEILPNQYIYVIFDGSFLSATRSPRQYEVEQLVDAAINSNKAFFGQERVVLTSSLTPEDAKEKLLTYPYNPLVQNTRNTYLDLL